MNEVFLLIETKVTYASPRIAVLLLSIEQVLSIRDLAVPAMISPVHKSLNEFPRFTVSRKMHIYPLDKNNGPPEKYLSKGKTESIENNVKEGKILKEG